MTISEIVAKIRSALYARDVRGAIADGIEQINNIAENAIKNADNVKQYAEQTRTYIEEITKKHVEIIEELPQTGDSESLYLSKKSPNSLGAEGDLRLKDMQDEFKYYSYWFQDGVYKLRGIVDLTGFVPEADDIVPGMVRKITGSAVYEPWKTGKVSEVASAYDIKHAIENGYWSDVEMSDDSTNMVQNKIIKQYVDEKIENKAKRYILEDSNEPTGRLEDYPGAEPGDICINKDYKVWICLYAEAGGIVWSELVTALGSYLWDSFYGKVQVDNKLKEKVDKADWKLIRTINIEEEIGAVEITKDEEENAFGYDDILITASNIKGTTGGNWWTSVKTTANLGSTGVIQVGNANSLSTSTSKGFLTKLKRMFGLNQYEFESSYKNTGGYVSTINRGIMSTSFELKEDSKISYIRIFFSSSNIINEGTICVYGRNRR